jgi:hypothetical protein
VLTTGHVIVQFKHMLSFIFVVVFGLHDCLFMYVCIVVGDPINRFNHCRIVVPVVHISSSYFHQQCIFYLFITLYFKLYFHDTLRLSMSY